jgi:hypothetical protein
MPKNESSTPAREYDRLVGAVDLLETLREDFAQWLEEAQNDSKREALENVLGHIETLESEYTQRRDEAHAQLQGKS